MSCGGAVFCWGKCFNELPEYAKVRLRNESVGRHTENEQFSRWESGVPGAEVTMKQTKSAFMAGSNGNLGPQALRQA